MQEPTIDETIALRLQALRQAHGFSLADLAGRSGVSKAMISRVERAESSASAALLGKLAAAFGLPLAELLSEPEAAPAPLRRRAGQETWRDPQAGYLRRQVMPRDAASGLELVEVELPAHARVAYPAWSGRAYRQALWLLEGALAVHHGEETHTLAAGDCLAFGVDRPLAYRALGRTRCRYLLAAVHPG